MKKILFAAVVFLSASTTAFAQNFRLQPTPQEYVFQNDSVPVPQAYRLHAGSSVDGQPALSLLNALLPGETSKADFQIYIGTTADKEMRKYRNRIPEKADGYFLKIEKDRIIIAGADRRGAYYGLQTLAQLLTLNRLPQVEVTDYPDVPYRGVVEGFYGIPWSHEARMDQLDFYGRNKMNIYIYGPKDDPYHRTPHWRKPYPEQEGERISQLVDRAKQNEVIFYWAVHPGVDIRWNEEDRSLLLQKLESVYRLGVRGFAVFFDDISGEGTKADKQAELLNYIDEHFVQAKEDVAPLIMCPTIYNRGWMWKDEGYTTALGEKLNQNIQIMWTGDQVVTTIDRGTLDFINPQFKRKSFIWWNYPVSDYVTDHMLLGPVYGNGLDIKDDVSAFVSNPMEHAEASKIALYGVADYTWNMEKYDSAASWKHALRAMMPAHAGYLETFAAHNSDPGPSGLNFRRDESAAIRPFLSALSDTYREKRTIDEAAYRQVAEECRKIVRSADVLLASGNENPALLKETAPWLHQFKLVGEYGQEVLKLITLLQQKEKFMESYTHLQALQILMYRTDTSYNQSCYRPGVKSGSKHLLPAFNALFETAVKRYNELYGTRLDTRAVYLPYTLESDVEQLAPLAMIREWNNVGISPADAVVDWQAGGSLTVSIEGADVLSAVWVDLGDIRAADFRLEVSPDGQEWRTVEMKPSENDTLLKAEPGDGKLLKVRLSNVSGVTKQVDLKMFRLTRR